MAQAAGALVAGARRLHQAHAEELRYADFLYVSVRADRARHSDRAAQEHSRAVFNRTSLRAVRCSGAAIGFTVRLSCTAAASIPEKAARSSSNISAPTCRRAATPHLC